MSFSYSQDPSDSDLDWVRWRVGDTDASNFFQHDAEIEAAIAEAGNKLLGAARVAEAIAGKFARNADTELETQSVKKSQRFEHYTKLAAELRRQALTRSGAVYAGGQSIAERDTDRADTDLVQPMFDSSFDNVDGAASES